MGVEIEDFMYEVYVDNMSTSWHCRKLSLKVNDMQPPPPDCPRILEHLVLSDD